jgi:cytochrome b6-f complex iron-sulfur subunit
MRRVSDMPTDKQQRCGAERECPLVSRREFIMKSSAALAGLAVLGAAGCGSVTEPIHAAFTVQLADHPELANVGSITRVFSGGSPVGISRLGLSSFESFSLVCPHEGQTVGIDTTREDYVCPGHGATYDQTGTWIGGAVQTRNLTMYTTTFDPVNGTITIAP